MSLAFRQQELEATLLDIVRTEPGHFPREIAVVAIARLGREISPDEFGEAVYSLFLNSQIVEVGGSPGVAGRLYSTGAGS